MSSIENRDDRSRSDPSPKIEPITMRVPDACRFLGIGRSTLYVLIATKEVEAVKMGSATLILTGSLHELMARRRCGHRQELRPTKR